MKSERGNALFLILIAVALFAALSYAVTQSGRGGGAGVDSEKLSLKAADLVQYMTATRTAAMRMDLFDNPSPFRFDQPGTPGYNVVAVQHEQMFHPDGGAINYRDLTADMADLCTASPCGSIGWDATNSVDSMDGVGTAAGDVIFFLGPMTQTACTEINTSLGLTGIVQTTVNYVSPYVYDAYPGEIAFCYQETAADGGNYWYVHSIFDY